MDDPHPENPALPAGREVIRHQFFDFPGLESVQVQDAINGEMDRLLAGRIEGFFGHSIWIRLRI